MIQPVRCSVPGTGWPYRPARLLGASDWNRRTRLRRPLPNYTGPRVRRPPHLRARSQQTNCSPAAPGTVCKMRSGTKLIGSAGRRRAVVPAVLDASPPSPVPRAPRLGRGAEYVDFVAPSPVLANAAGCGGDPRPSGRVPAPVPWLDDATRSVAAQRSLALPRRRPVDPAEYGRRSSREREQDRGRTGRLRPLFDNAPGHAFR